MAQTASIVPERPLVDFYRNVYRNFKLFKDRPPAKDPYVDAIRQFHGHLGREPVLEDLTTDTVASWMKAMVDAGKARSTANTRMRHLKALARFAVRRGMLAEAFDLDRYRVPKRLPEAWSVEEMDAIIRSSRQTKGMIVGIEACKWWPALLLTLYDTGLRRTAALGIRFEELDFTRKSLRVPAERMKNSVEQVFHLHDQTIEAILATLPPARAALFPWPYKGSYSKRLNQWLREIIQGAGLKCTARDLFHKLRRTCATQIALTLGEHIAIQQLGHLSPGTIKSYIDPRFLANHTAARQIERPGWDAATVKITAAELNVGPRPIAMEIVRNIDVFKQEIEGGARDVLAELLAKSELCATDLRAALRALRMSPVEFAKASGITNRVMNGILVGGRPVSRDASVRIRVCLGLTFTYSRQQNHARALP